jgi:hypothetical protein
MKRLFTLDLRSLALCRIFAGFLVAADVLDRCREFRLFYSSSGILPRLAVFPQGGHFPNVYLMSDLWLWQVLLLVIHFLAGVALCLGYRTRLSTALCWYLQHCLMLRNFLVNNGGDNVLVCLLFWAMFLPWGERASLDGLGRAPEPEPENQVFSVATVGLLNQMLILYWSSVFFKFEPTWLNGQAIYYALECDLYSRSTRDWLLPYPGLLQALCYLTLVWESLGPLLLLSGWWRLRLLALGAFSFMHLSFGVFLRLGIFAFTPQLVLLALLPSQVWSRPWRRWAWAQRLRALLPPVPPPAPLRLGSWSYPLLALMLFSWMEAMGTEQKGGPNRLIPPSLSWVSEWTGLRQRWSVFVNLSQNLDGWVLVQAQLSDGSSVDLFQGRDPFRWDKPVPVSELHPGFRWPTPLVTIIGRPNLQGWFLAALAADWNAGHPGRKVRKASFYLMYEPTLPDYRDSPPQPKLLREWSPS